MTNLILTPTKKAMTCMMTHKLIQQVFSEESDDDEFCCFESIIKLLILVCLRYNMLLWLSGRNNNNCMDVSIKWQTFTYS
jgi:hypothetical protein